MNGGSIMPTEELLNRSGLSPALPLVGDRANGIRLNKSIVNMVKQNLKMLLLTSPGERVGVPEFGVGLKRYLFEPALDYTYNSIKNRIQQQVSKYMSSIILNNIEIVPDGNAIILSINYTIAPLKQSDTLSLSTTVQSSEKIQISTYADFSENPPNTTPLR
jgi:phage baseplate assembly protein W